MALKLVCLTFGALALVSGQSNAVLTNPATAKWEHDKGDPPGAESVLLRSDEKSGGMELLVRYPAGHVFKPHWHESNERIIVLEGQLTFTHDSGDTTLDAGGTAFLPSREVQRMSCTSSTRCAFYLAWDGKPKSYAAK